MYIGSMMNMMIRISKLAAKKLKQKSITKRESYDEIILRLLNELK
jgi:hypothetical protein